MKVFGLLLLCCLPAVAQSPESLKYAPLPILLVNPEPGGEGVMPMVFLIEGKQTLVYVKTSQIKEAQGNGGQPVRLGDVVSILKGATETINKLQAENVRLQAENERLWKVAMKDAPQPQAPTVVVQAVPQQPSALERYALLRSMLPAPQPYQLPMPQPMRTFNPATNRLQTNCISSKVNGSTFTNCY
jgi:hypothetical protein